ncbi:MAG: hypothetical protein HRU09_03350 [Oligoflexales bacterium]|nr:hypothetical protein [Oligoflexales bacterium]
MFFSGLSQVCDKRVARLILGLILITSYLLMSSCGVESNPQFQDIAPGIKATLVEKEEIETVEEEDLEVVQGADASLDPEQVLNGFEPAEGDGEDDRVIVLVKQKPSSEQGEGASDTEETELIEIDLDNLNPDILGEGTVGTSTDADGQTVYSQVLVMLQPVETRVDILWVIDSSLSMSEEQTYLGQNFSSFITALAGSNQEFQTSVTTTDICRGIDYLDLNLDPATLPPLSERACPFIFGGDASTQLRGSFVGEDGRKVLHANDPDLIAKFNDYTNVGTNGSNFEHGLRATSMAVEKVLSGENENLIRDDAYLSVVIVSDEEDEGIGLNQFDPSLGFNPTAEGWTSFSYTNDNLIDYLNSVKGKGNFSISTITGTRQENGDLCTSPHSCPTEEGTAFIDAANKTGGIVQSICDSNWADSLSQMGQDLNAQISQINLMKSPIESSIKVFVNDSEYEHWTFIDGNNSLKFNSDAIPEPGSSIVVAYDSLEP